MTYLEGKDGKDSLSADMELPGQRRYCPPARMMKQNVRYHSIVLIH